MFEFEKDGDYDTTKELEYTNMTVEQFMKEYINITPVVNFDEQVCRILVKSKNTLVICMET